MTALWRGLLLLLFCLLSAVLFAGPAEAEKRVALVIGNASYEHTTPLKNPRGDATAISAALQRLDFKVLLGVDVDEASFRGLAREFAEKVEDAEVALFFYAGHGLQVNGRNYLLPVSASLKRELDLEFETVSLDLVLTQMERGQRINIVLLDACRNNPLVHNLARSMGTRSAALGRGLARVETAVGSYVGFSTQPGNVALDGEGEHSPFAAALLKNIETPDLEIETLMRQVREEVIKATNGKQVPWGNSSLVGRGFVFNPIVPADATATNQTPNRPIQPPTVTDQANIEIAFWNSIKDSEDAHMFKAYLDEYPQGRFAALAKIKLERLSTGKASKAAGQQASIEPSERQTESPAEDVVAAAAETALWERVKGTGEPKLIQTYLDRFPKGRFAGEAKVLLDKLEAKQAALPDVSDLASEAKSNRNSGVISKQKKSKASAIDKRKPAAKDKRKPAVALSKPKPIATPRVQARECGWCGIGAGFNDAHFCGAQYQQLKARGKCR